MTAVLVFLIGAGALAFVPGPIDSFELPKRFFSCALAVVLAFDGCFFCRRERGAVLGNAPAQGAVVPMGVAVLAWMILRTAAECAFWRTALPLVSFATPLLCFVLAVARPWPDERIRAISGSVFALGAAEALLMICQRLGLDFPAVATPDDGYAPARMIGTFGYHNQAAEFLCVAIGAGWICQSLRRENRGWGRLRFTLFAAATVLMAAAVVLTANRGAILALVSQGVLAMAMEAGAARKTIKRNAANDGRHSPGRLLLAGVAFLALVVLLAAIPEVRARFRELLLYPLSSSAVRTRVTMWRAAIALFSSNPLFGGGAGAFAYRYIDLLGEIMPATKEHANLTGAVWAQEAHCDPLQFLAEFGIVGVALFCVFILFALKAVLRRDVARGGLAALAILGAVTICSLFSFSWQTSMAAPVAALLAGATCAGSGARKPEGLEAAPIRAPVMPWLLGLMLSLAFLGVAACANVGNLLTASFRFPANARESAFLRGRIAARAASAALEKGDYAWSAALAEEASEDYLSPELLLAQGMALRALRRPDEALGAFSSLAKSGLGYREALKGVSLCLEDLGRTGEALKVEDERFRLFAGEFADAEVYRLAAMHLVCGDAAGTEKLSRSFFNRALRKGEKQKITAEWENLRGGALLSLGRREEARTHFEEALRRKPNLKSARRNLDALDARP